MASPKNTAVIATYGDHEVITPENKLRKAVSAKPLGDDGARDDPIGAKWNARKNFRNNSPPMATTSCPHSIKKRHAGRRFAGVKLQSS